MNEPQTPPVLTEIPRYATDPAPYAVPVAESTGIPRINLILFFVTLLTTTLAGAYLNGIDNPYGSFSNFAAGFSFSIPLMTILLCHEMGHFIMARRNNVSATWPYFIPAPLPGVFIAGTFGAFIRMRSQPRSRRVMFDIGAAGPWAGALLAIPAVVIGLRLSEVAPLENAAGIELGNSLLFWGLSRVVLGVDPNTVTINLHPIALAGWFGLFVTTLNLLPVGQLDGGHVIYALFGPRHRIISRLFVLSCVGMVVVPYLLGWSYWPGWVLWAVLLIVLGIGHPSTADVDTPLDGGRRIAAWMTIGLFMVTFSPVPLSFTSPPPRLPKGETFEV